jgi:hypothetical protein
VTEERSDLQSRTATKTTEESGETVKKEIETYLAREEKYK